MNPREKFMEMIAKKKMDKGGKAPVAPAKGKAPAIPPKKGGFPPKKAC